VSRKPLTGAPIATRLVDELLWTLRRAGVTIATSQAIDAARAVQLLGFASKDALRDALAAIVVQRAADTKRFVRAFDEHFALALGGPRSFWDRLARDFTREETALLRELLEAQGVARAASGDGDEPGSVAPLASLLAVGDAELGQLLAAAEIRRALAPMKSRQQVGFFGQRVLQAAGVHQARTALAALRRRLVDALGAERGAALADALASELDRVQTTLRDHVARTAEERESGGRDEDGQDRRLATTDFAALSAAEILEVRLAVRRFVEKLAGGERVRRRRARRGKIDPRRTLRHAFATGGVPLLLARKKRTRGKPRLMILCDISDSVRATARFMLELTYAAQELFERTRSFVFVSEIGEATDLFARNGTDGGSIETALARAYGGAVVPVTGNSSYGRALRQFEARHGFELDRRTTLVVLGDGRSNYGDDGAEVLGRLRDRVRAVIWLTPEGRGTWMQGDSAMGRYERASSKVLTVRCARELEDAARLLVSLR
jgi:uncharacterized protein with von Willebrand factor type A (vWA) domain